MTGQVDETVIRDGDHRKILVALCCIHMLAGSKIVDAICDHQDPDPAWVDVLKKIEEIVPQWAEAGLP